MGTKDFDPKSVGYVLKPLTERGFSLDTSIPGNSNQGHEVSGTQGPKALPPPAEGCAPDEAAGINAEPGLIEAKSTQPPVKGVRGPELSDDQRWALIEYLKNPPQ